MSVPINIFDKMDDRWYDYNFCKNKIKENPENILCVKVKNKKKFNILVRKVIRKYSFYTYFLKLVNINNLLEIDTIKLLIKKRPFIFRYINNPDREIQKYALSIDGTLIKYIDNPDLELKEIALKQNIKSILYINNISNDIILKYILLDKNIYEYIKVLPAYFIKDKLNKNEILKVLSKEPNFIKYINNPTEEEQLIAVQNNTYAIQYINNPTDKVIWKFIKNNFSYIEYVLNKIQNKENIIKYILKNNPNYIINVNQTPELVYYALKYGLKDYELIHITKEEWFKFVNNNPELFI